MYDTILKAIPNLWRNELRVINPVNVDIPPSMIIGINMREFLNTTFLYAPP
jgi:hypothetical protein